MKTFSESDIKAAIVDMMTSNGENVERFDLPFDRGYFEGVHDGMLDILNHLEIENDFDYYVG